MRRGGEGFEERVLVTFVEGGRLNRLPARRKKRLVVLRWLADQFRPAERYPETTINDILSRHGEDVATLRRYLVDEELMQRRSGLYWRAGTLPPP
jgi:hypothetical protein